MELLDRLVNDPAWAWLRPLSSLIAEVDHALAQQAEFSSAERAAAAAHVRGLLFGEGDLVDPAFLAHYRSLLQLEHALASTHGELRKLLKTLPDESLNGIGTPARAPSVGNALQASPCEPLLRQAGAFQPESAARAPCGFERYTVTRGNVR